MKRVAMVLSGLLALGLVWLAFGVTYVCVPAAIHRWSSLSSIGICPSFVRVSNEELLGKFTANVHVGDPKQRIESELDRLGIGYSWDPHQDRYQGIIRAPDSNFHAIVVYVHVDGNGAFRNIEIEDVFTAL